MRPDLAVIRPRYLRWTAANSVIEVKRSLSKGTPPGWHHGRKVGWHGRGEPPGQAKKP